MKLDGKRLFAAGRAGMRQNLLPGLALWLLALLLVLVHHTVPAARAFFEGVGLWKVRGGLTFSAVTTAFFGGVLPVVVLMARGRGLRRGWPAALAFYTLFWAYKGVEVDLFYRLQAHMFGDQASPATIAKKVLVDQLVYNPLWAAPSTALAYLWMETGFSWRATRAKLGADFLLFSVPVILMSTWAVWLPAVTIIYCLPGPLQIPLFNLVLCFWVLVLSFISKPADDDRGPPSRQPRTLR
jgi:hypothetical protein